MSPDPWMDAIIDPEVTLTLPDDMKSATYEVIKAGDSLTLEGEVTVFMKESVCTFQPK